MSVIRCELGRALDRGLRESANVSRGVQAYSFKTLLGYLKKLLQRKMTNQNEPMLRNC